MEPETSSLEHIIAKADVFLGSVFLLVLANKADPLSAGAFNGKRCFCVSSFIKATGALLAVLDNIPQAAVLPQPCGSCFCFSKMLSVGDQTV